MFKCAGWWKGPDPSSWLVRRWAEVKVGQPNSPSALIYPVRARGSVGGGTLPRVITQAADNRHFIRTEACRCRSRPLAAPTLCDRTLIGAALLEVSDLFQWDREAPWVLSAVTSRLLPHWNISNQLDMPANLQAEDSTISHRFVLSHWIIFLSHCTVTLVNAFPPF